jgi:hypothetical protein
MKLGLIKENEKGKNYQADGFKIVYRHKGAVSGDNAENVNETLYLVTGKAEVTILDKVEVYTAPAQFEIPAKTYHKIVALEDLSCLLFEEE